MPRCRAKIITQRAHQIGFNDLKAIEVLGFLRAIAGEIPEPFGFAAGARIQALVETIAESARAGAWRRVPDTERARVDA